jgi:GrpB-like predicted nucleotidyltransferase (UPF0157 family)
MVWNYMHYIYGYNFVSSKRIGIDNVHIFQRDNPEVRRHLNFRDYMIAHPEDAKLYAEQ